MVLPIKTIFVQRSLYEASSWLTCSFVVHASLCLPHLYPLDLFSCFLYELFNSHFYQRHKFLKKLTSFNYINLYFHDFVFKRVRDANKCCTLYFGIPNMCWFLLKREKELLFKTTQNWELPKAGTLYLQGSWQIPSLNWQLEYEPHPLRRLRHYLQAVCS